MASRQLLRRLSPILCNASRVPVARSAGLLSRQLILSQNLTSQLTAVRFMSGKGQDQEIKLDVINIQDEEDFQEKVFKSEKPVVVDFHANWCGPCKLLGPRLESLVGSENGKIVMAKVDIDENVELAMRFNVESVPTVFAIKDGKIVKRFIGLKDDDEIKSFLQVLL